MFGNFFNTEDTEGTEPCCEHRVQSIAEDTEPVKRCLRHCTERLRIEKRGVSPL